MVGNPLNARDEITVVFTEVEMNFRLEIVDLLSFFIFKSFGKHFQIFTQPYEKVPKGR